MRDITKYDMDLALRIVSNTVPYIKWDSVIQVELESAAMLALTYAARIYDPGLGVPWNWYLALRVRGEVLDMFKKECRARNNGVEFTRLESCLDSEDYDSLPADCAPGPEEMLLNKEDTLNKMNQIHAILKLLPSKQRSIIKLHYFSNLNFATIAKRLHISEEWVRQLHHRAIKGMKESVEC